MQSLIVIACKILRVIHTILKTGTTYDPQKQLKDIKRPVEAQAPMGGIGDWTGFWNRNP